MDRTEALIQIKNKSLDVMVAINKASKSKDRKEMLKVGLLILDLNDELIEILRQDESDFMDGV